LSHRAALKFKASTRMLDHENEEAWVIAISKTDFRKAVKKALYKTPVSALRIVV
jgi:hypothetical protein